MNNKYLLQDLTQSLQQTNQFDKREVEIFIRTIFSKIDQALFEDGLVKIQDLGTFKMIKINARQSVDVNTGEKIEIKEHYKVTFLPDDILKSEVNKPYAHLETVDISTAATQEEDMEEEEIATSSTSEELTTKNTTIMSKSSEPIFEVSEMPEDNQTPQKPKSKTGIIIAWIVFAVLVLGLLGYALWSVFLVPAVVDDFKENAVVQTIVTEEPSAEVSSVPMVEEIDPAKWETHTIVPLEKNQRLTLLALKYYGNKVFWVYIYEANKNNIANPNEIKAGTKIRIPKAPASIVDPRNSETINRAKVLEEKYKAQFAK